VASRLSPPLRCAQERRTQPGCAGGTTVRAEDGESDVVSTLTLPMVEAVAVRARSRVLHSAPASRASCPSTSATECARLNRNEENSLGAMRGFPMRVGAPPSVGTGIGKAQPEERRRQAWPLVLGRSLSLSPRPISRKLRRPALLTPGEPAGPQFLFGSVHMPPQARAAWRPCSLLRAWVVATTRE